MKIREANDSDINGLVDLEKLIFSDDSWSCSDFQEQLHLNPYASIYVLEDNNKIVGYVDLWIAYENGEIANIGVHPFFRGKGYGCMLMDYCMKRIQCAGCETVSLECRVSNIPAIHLYEKYGFKKAGIRKKYYADGEDAFLMVKNMEVIL